jgi:hypothetical protein
MSTNHDPEPKQKRAYNRKSVVKEDETPAGFEEHWIEGRALHQISSEPPKDPESGDKTPAYVEWFRDTYTEEEFTAKYGSRKHHLNQVQPTK